MAVRVRYCECDPMGVRTTRRTSRGWRWCDGSCSAESGVSRDWRSGRPRCVPGGGETGGGVPGPGVLRRRGGGSDARGGAGGESVSRVKIRHEYEVVLVESDSSRGGARKRELGRRCCARRRACWRAWDATGGCASCRSGSWGPGNEQSGRHDRRRRRGGGAKAGGRLHAAWRHW